MEAAAGFVPNHPLRILNALVLPTPTPSILTISLLILIRSAPKNDVIPLTLIVVSNTVMFVERPVVTAVETTGDWITLSIATRTFAFWLVATNLWDVPIPTLSSSTAIGTALSALVALAATLIVLSSTLIAKISSPGKNVLFPTPENDVVAIPIAEVTSPTWAYSIFSPLTKKWFGIVIVLSVRLITFESFPTTYLSNISSFSWVNPKVLIISDSVPV